MLVVGDGSLFMYVYVHEYLHKPSELRAVWRRKEGNRRGLISRSALPNINKLPPANGNLRDKSLTRDEETRFSCV